MELTVLLSAIGSILLTVAIAEFRAWCPKLTKWVKRMSVARLPSALKERLDEEWEGHLFELPEGVVKLLVACGFMLAAFKISSDTSSRRVWRNILRTYSMHASICLTRCSNKCLEAALWLRKDCSSKNIRYRFGMLIGEFALRHLWLRSLRFLCLSVRYTDCPCCRTRLVGQLREMRDDLRQLDGDDRPQAIQGPWSS